MSPNESAKEGLAFRVGIGLLLAVSAISFGAIFFRLAAPTAPAVAAGTRLGVAALLLLPSTVRGLRSTAFTPAMRKAAAIGGIFYGLHFGAWAWSLEMTTVAASVTLVTATPLLLGVVALVTGRDRPSRRFWWALGIAIVGVLVIVGADFSSSRAALAGDGLAVVGAAAMAGYLLTVRRAGKVDTFAFMGIATAVGATLLFATSALAGLSLRPASGALLWLILAAAVPQLIGHTSLTWCLRHAKPTTVGMATVGEPVGSSILAWIWLDEAFSTGVAVGCGITVTAVLIAVHSFKRQLA